MARTKGQQMGGPIPKRMEFAGTSSGVLDTSTLNLPPTSLESWFADEAKLAAFRQPVKPRV